MFRKLLIAVDDSSCSERAGRVGLEFARKLGAKVVFAHVLKAPPTYLGLAVPSEALDKYARDLLEPWVSLMEQMGIEGQTHYTRDDDISEGILYTANFFGCDLIVMGTHGREGLRKVFLGSVAERVSRLSPIPVMLVRGNGKVEPSTGAFERILAPVDGSEAGKPAFQLADSLASGLGAELQILHVVPPMPTPLADPLGMGAMALINWDETEQALAQEGITILDAAKASAKSPQVLTEMVRAGVKREAQVIAEYAHQHKADLIVMGTHGRTGLDYLLLGSVAQGVAHHAEVPLLLVRAEQAPKPQEQATKLAAQT